MRTAVRIEFKVLTVIIDVIGIDADIERHVSHHGYPLFLQIFLQQRELMIKLILNELVKFNDLFMFP